MRRDQSKPRAPLTPQITDQSASYFPEDNQRRPKILEDEDDLTTVQMRGKFISSKHRSSSRALRSDIIDRHPNGTRKKSHNKFYIFPNKAVKRNLVKKSTKHISRARDSKNT